MIRQRRKSSATRAKELLDLTLKAQHIDGKIVRLDLIKIKNLCSVKDADMNIAIQVTDWEKIFANCISSKGLLYRIYKEFLKPNSKKQKIQFKTWAKDTKSHFTEEVMHMEIKHMRR